VGSIEDVERFIFFRGVVTLRVLVRELELKNHFGQFLFKLSEAIYHFEDLKTSNRMQKTSAQNIDFEESYDLLNFPSQTNPPKMVFELQLPNQSPERNDSSEENEPLDILYRSHLVRLHLEGTIIFGP